jgi:hypothetical protein
MKFYNLYRDHVNDCWLRNPKLYQVYYCVTKEKSRNKKITLVYKTKKIYCILFIIL